MTISAFEFDLIGMHPYTPEGPYGTAGNFPLPSVKPGTVVAGDNGGEFIFLLFPVVTAMTLNQGDAVCWDNTMVASRTGEISVTGEYDIGLNVGTVNFGGTTGGVAGGTGIAGNAFNFTFATGTYGIWAQRAGPSLANINATTTLAIPTTIGGNRGRITFLAVPTKSNAISPGSLGFMQTSKTFTADTLTGSTTLLNVNVGKFVQKGMALTGTGIPGTTGFPVTTVLDFTGSTITMSAAATATNVANVNTALANSTSGFTASGSPILTGVASILGFYPNQTIAGTGIPAATTIVSIGGTSAPFTITMSANATATSAAGVYIAFSTTAMPNYGEVFLNWPIYSAATSA